MGGAREWEYGRREGGEVKQASARCIEQLVSRIVVCLFVVCSGPGRTCLSFDHSTNNHSNVDCKRYKTVTKNSQNAFVHLWQPQS